MPDEKANKKFERQQRKEERKLRRQKRREEKKAGYDLP
jgi:hypothetical protein